VPLSNRAGKLVKAEGPSLLFADFEDGSISHQLSGNWESEFDQNKLGTTLNPSPLKLTPGGYKGSKNCLRFWGHFGKSGAPPWPYADIGAGMPSLSAGLMAGVVGFFGYGLSLALFVLALGMISVVAITAEVARRADLLSLVVTAWAGLLTASVVLQQSHSHHRPPLLHLWRRKETLRRLASNLIAPS